MLSDGSRMTSRSPRGCWATTSAEVGDTGIPCERPYNFGLLLISMSAFFSAYSFSLLWSRFIHCRKRFSDHERDDISADEVRLKAEMVDKRG